MKKNLTGHHSRCTNMEAIEIIRQMASRFPDDQIDATLNRLGLKTGSGNNWVELRVRTARSYHKLPSYDPTLRQNMLTLEEASESLGVSHKEWNALVMLTLLYHLVTCRCRRVQGDALSAVAHFHLAPLCAHPPPLGDYCTGADIRSWAWRMQPATLAFKGPPSPGENGRRGGPPPLDSGPPESRCSRPTTAPGLKRSWRKQPQLAWARLHGASDSRKSRSCLLAAGAITGVGQIVLRRLSSGNRIDTTAAIWFYAGRLPSLRT